MSATTDLIARLRDHYRTDVGMAAETADDIANAAAALTTQEEELARLREALEVACKDRDAWHSDYKRQNQRALAAEQSFDEALKALKPFAKMADAMFRLYEDGHEMNAGKDDLSAWGFDEAELKYGDFRHARALSGATPSQSREAGTK